MNKILNYFVLKLVILSIEFHFFENKTYNKYLPLLDQLTKGKV